MAENCRPAHGQVDFQLVVNSFNEEFHCPFSWEYVMFRHLGLGHDKIYLVQSTWDMIIKKCHLACAEHDEGSTGKARALIAECYMPLLPLSGFETNCSLVRDYRDGLKHVLDSSSAIIGSDSIRYRYEMIWNCFASITPHCSLNTTQQAAIAAIASRVTPYPCNVKFASRAVAMCPTEAKWHCYLADALYEAVERNLYDHAKGVDPESEVCHPELDVHKHMVKHISLAFELERDVPEAFVLMAKVLVESDTKKTLSLIETAIDKFPGNTWVLAESAFLLRKVTAPLLLKPSHASIPSIMSMCKRAADFFKQALELIEGDCISLRFQLGKQQQLVGSLIDGYFEEYREEGVRNLAKAAEAVFLPPEIRSAIHSLLNVVQRNILFCNCTKCIP